MHAFDVLGDLAQFAPDLATPPHQQNQQPGG
jgi:hypothetical protein